MSILLALTLTLSAHAEQFGPVTVTPLPTLGGAVTAGYMEYRFTLSNLDHAGHEVGLTLVANGYREVGTLRVTRRVAVPARATIELPILCPVLETNTADEVRVAVDGHPRDPALRLPSMSDPYGVTPQLLMSHSFPDTNLLAAIKANGSDDDFRTVRSQLSPQQWSTTWLAYTSFRVVLMTADDWAELPAAAQGAILRWVRTGGGSLLVLGPDASVPGVQRTDGVAGAPLGFGRVFFLRDAEELKTASPLNEWKHLQRTGQSPGALQLLFGKKVPTTSLFSILLLFAVVSGPANLFLLARRNRRLWVFWTVPALALVTTGVMMIWTLSREGWLRVNRSSSVTLLDENAGEATTIGLTGFYSTLPPDGRIRFSTETQLMAYRVPSEGDLAWSDGQRLESGWVESRISTYFAFRKCEARRERLVVHHDGGRVTVVNGLGSKISQMWYSAPDGSIHFGTAIEPGARATLVPTGGTVPAGYSLNAEMFLQPDSWSSLVDRLKANPMTALQPGGYVAIVTKSPFADHPLEGATADSARAAIIGIVKRSGDAR